MNWIVVLLIFLSERAWGQDFFSFLSPKSPNTVIELEGLFMPESEVEKTKKAQVLSQTVGVSQKVYEHEKHSVILGGKWQKLDFSPPEDSMRDYYNIQGSVGYKRLTESNRFWSVSGSYGSASDKPFQNGRDGTISLNYLQQFSNNWFGVLNYSNNRTFLNNVPLPGFFYVKEMTHERALIFGFPIIYWMRPVGHHWTFRYFGILPWAHRLRLSFNKWKILRPYFGYEESPQSYFRHDREKRRDRVFWFDRRISLGAEILLKGIRLDISGGYAFDRQLYEARNFQEKKNFLFNLENGYFAGLSFRYNF